MGDPPPPPPQDPALVAAQQEQLRQAAQVNNKAVSTRADTNRAVLGNMAGITSLFGTSGGFRGVSPLGGATSLLGGGSKQ
jgi:hypothetical protein